MISAKELQTQFYQCMPLFIALGDEVRLSIIESLVHSMILGEEGMNVKEITQRTKLSRPAVSHHLKILKKAGFISVKHRGTCNFYYLTLQEPTQRLMALGQYLSHFYA